MELSQIPLPFPVITTPDFHTVKIEWYDFLDDLELAGLKCAIEVSTKRTDYSNWEVIYIGRSDHCVCTKMTPGVEYYVRLRLCQGDEFGPYGEVQKVEMPEEPNSGSDLHKVIRFEDYEKLTSILEMNKSHLEAVDQCDFTPLMSATSRNLKDITALLLKYGANPNTSNRLGKTALMLAANKGFTDIVEILISAGANPNARDINGMHCVFYAVDGENANMIRVLHKHGALMDQEDFENHWTPLIRLACLANNGNVRVGTALLDCGADPNAQDKYGQTPLMHCAFHKNHVDLAKLLLTRGADPDLRNRKNNTAREIAESLENMSFIQMFDRIKRTIQKNT